MKRIHRPKKGIKGRGPFGMALILTLSVLTTLSCSPFKPAGRSSVTGELPGRYSLYSEAPPGPDRWWERFADPELNALVTEGLSGSFTLQEAWARLNQARATALQARAARYPDLTISGAASASRQRVDQGSGGSTQNSESYSIGAAGGYELDLWGKIRAEEQAATLSTAASREDLNTAAITLAAEITTHWINVISTRTQKRLLESQLETNRTYLELIELRYRKSMATALEIYQQRQVVEKVRANIPLVESEEQLLCHELALLLGKPPKADLGIHRQTLPLIADLPATGLPADLLAARPDIRAAGLRLQAVDWQVAAARANRLPAISLSASGSYGADELNLIFSNWLINLAANLTAPIWDGHNRAAEVDRTLAVADENLAAYRLAVYTAVKEVEDALVGEAKLREHVQALDDEIDAAGRALEEARTRYLNGVDDYLPVLTQLLTIQDLEQDMIQRQAELLVQRVSLHRALGGTWPQSLEPGPKNVNLSNEENRHAG